MRKWVWNRSFFNQTCWGKAEKIYIYIYINISSYQLLKKRCLFKTCVIFKSLLRNNSFVIVSHDMPWILRNFTYGYGAYGYGLWIRESSHPKQPAIRYSTLPETSMGPENWWLEDYFPFGIPSFQVRTVSFRKGTSKWGVLEMKTTLDHLEMRGAILVSGRVSLNHEGYLSKWGIQG